MVEEHNGHWVCTCDDCGAVLEVDGEIEHFFDELKKQGWKCYKANTEHLCDKCEAEIPF